MRLVHTMGASLWGCGAVSSVEPPGLSTASHREHRQRRRGGGRRSPEGGSVRDADGARRKRGGANRDERRPRRPRVERAAAHGAAGDAEREVRGGERPQRGEPCGQRGAREHVQRGAVEGEWKSHFRVSRKGNALDDGDE